MQALHKTMRPWFGWKGEFMMGAHPGDCDA